jgi:hypothetical protein
MDTECCWCFRTRMERSVCFRLSKKNSPPLLISFIELRHKGRLDSMNSLLVLTHILGPNGSPWGNNFSSILRNLLYVPDHHSCRLQD